MGVIVKDACEDVPLQRRLGLDIIDQEKTLSGISAIVMVCGGGDRGGTYGGEGHYVQWSYL